MAQFLQSDNYMTTTDAAEELGITRKRINDLIRDGKLGAYQIGWVWVVSETELRRFQAARASEALNKAERLFREGGR